MRTLSLLLLFACLPSTANCSPFIEFKWKHISGAYELHLGDFQFNSRATSNQLTEYIELNTDDYPSLKTANIFKIDFPKSSKNCMKKLTAIFTDENGEIYTEKRDFYNGTEYNETFYFKDRNKKSFWSFMTQRLLSNAPHILENVIDNKTSVYNLFLNQVFTDKTILYVISNKELKINELNVRYLNNVEFNFNPRVRKFNNRFFYSISIAAGKKVSDIIIHTENIDDVDDLQIDISNQASPYSKQEAISFELVKHLNAFSSVETIVEHYCEEKLNLELTAKENMVYESDTLPEANTKSKLINRTLKNVAIDPLPEAVWHNSAYSKYAGFKQSEVQLELESVSLPHKSASIYKLIVWTPKRKNLQQCTIMVVFSTDEHKNLKRKCATSSGDSVAIFDIPAEMYLGPKILTDIHVTVKKNQAQNGYYKTAIIGGDDRLQEKIQDYPILYWKGEPIFGSPALWKKIENGQYLFSIEEFLELMNMPSAYSHLQKNEFINWSDNKYFKIQLKEIGNHNSAIVRVEYEPVLILLFLFILLGKDISISGTYTLKIKRIFKRIIFLSNDLNK